jgi:hypothetical protein
MVNQRLRTKAAAKRNFCSVDNSLVQRYRGVSNITLTLSQALTLSQWLV